MVRRNLTALENILSRSMVLTRSAFVLLVVVGGVGGAGVAHAQETRAISIDDALAGAERAADGLAAARARALGAGHQVDAAKSAYYPQVNASASYTFTALTEFDIDLSAFTPDFRNLLCPNQIPDSGLPPTSDNFFCQQSYQDFFAPAPSSGDSSLPFGQRNTWRAGVNVTQQVYDFGRTRASVNAAKVGVALAKLSEQQVRAAAVLTVATAYYDAVLAQAQVDITRASLASAEEVWKDAQLQNSQGAIAEFDVVRAEVARDNEQNAVVQAQAGRDAAFLRVKRVLGIPLDQAISLTSGLDVGDPAEVDGVIAQARRAAGLAAGKRLAVVQAELAVDASRHARAIAAADRLPVITAVTDFGVVDYSATPFNADWRTNWTLGLNVSFPIFDGFRRRALVRKADADLAAARAQLDDTRRATDLGAAQADTQIAAALATWQASGRTVTQAQRAYQIAELRFGQGASTQLELVDARLQLSRAEVNRARSAHDLRLARLRRELFDALPAGAAAGF